MFDLSIRQYLRKYFLLFSRLLLCGGIIVLLWVQVIRVLAIPSYGAWGIFHYYLGAKYIKELGYFDLYACALQVTNARWDDTHAVRDLRTYKIVPLKQLPRCPQNNFTQQRWLLFATDTSFILSHASSKYWSQVVTDKGFNPPPSWAALAGSLANSLPLNGITYFILFNFDLLCILITAVIVWWDSGYTVAGITLGLSLLYFGTIGILGNNFLQYVWYPVVVCAVIAWRRNKAILSGIGIGIASGLQVFPVLFAIPLGFYFLESWLHRQQRTNQSTKRFLIALVLTLICCITIGSLYGGGTPVWQQWYKKISLQKNWLNGEMFDIGLLNTVGIIMSQDRSNSSSYAQDYFHTLYRNTVLNHYSVVIDVLISIFVVGIGICMVKRRHYHPMLFGYFFIYLFLSLSPYYYLILALLPFMVWHTSSSTRRLTLLSTGSLFLFHLVLFSNDDYVSFIFWQQVISKLVIFFFFIILFLIVLKGDKGEVLEKTQE